MVGQDPRVLSYIRVVLSYVRVANAAHAVSTAGPTETLDGLNLFTDTAYVIVKSDPLTPFRRLSPIALSSSATDDWDPRAL